MYRILIVEDEEIVRESLKESDWSSLGFEVVDAVSNGAEALEVISVKKPQVILTDIRMPDMDGITLMREVRQRGSDIEFVLLSGYSEFEYAQKAIQLSAFAYLTKPIDEEKFNDTFIQLQKKVSEKEKTIIHHITGDLSESLEGLHEVFLISILNKTMRAEFVQLRSKELRLNLCGNYICIAAIEISNYNSAVESDPSKIYKDSIRYWLHKQVPAVLLNQRIIVFKSSAEKLTIYDITKEMDHFEKHMQQVNSCRDIRINAGISSIHTDFAYIPQLYKEALHALNFKFYYGDGSVIGYGGIKHKIGKTLDSSTMNMYTNKIVDAALGLHGTELTNSIHSFFNHILDIIPLDTEPIYMKCLEVFLVLDRKCREREVVISVMSSKSELYAEMKNCTEIHTLKKWFVEKINKILNSLELESRERSNNAIWKACKYIQTNIDKRLTLEDIAEYIHMNPSYLSSIFKKIMGENLNNYINNCKIEKAKEYLNTSEMSVQEISDRLGFSEYRYFCMVFKKRTGKTPLEYRKNKLFDNF